MSRDKEIILDLDQALHKILTFTKDMSKEEFINDEKTQSSVLYQLVIVGEAINRLSDEFKLKYPKIPFTEIRGMRNRVVHEYNEIDCDIVWKAIENDVPILLSLISPFIPHDR